MKQNSDISQVSRRGLDIPIDVAGAEKYCEIICGFCTVEPLHWLFNSMIGEIKHILLVLK